MLPAALPRAVLLERQRARRWRWAVGLLAVLVSVYALAVGLMAWQQERLLFRPVKVAPGQLPSLPPGVDAVQVPVDGAVLTAWHLRQPGAKGVVFFLHGNGGDLESWFTHPEFWREAGFDVFMIDYRGYGQSTGHIRSEAQLHADVRRAWDQVAPAYAGRRKVIYGRSLGTGLAAALASEVQADLLVLVSPYQSLTEVVAEQYPWVPTALLRYPMPTDAWLPQVDAPVLIFHGEADRLIPFAQGARLAQVARRATLVALPGIGHADVQDSALYRDTLAARLRAL
jgi:alpha-beta hydrolase superfamily lysophospholipase